MSLFLLFEFFFLRFLPSPFSPPRWLYPYPFLIPVAFARAALRPLLTLLSPHVLTSNFERAPQRRYWLSGHTKARPDSLTTKFYWRLPRDGNFSPLDDDSAKNYEARNAAPHDRCAIHSVAIVNAKKFCRYEKFYCNKNCSIIPKDYRKLLYINKLVL